MISGPVNNPHQKHEKLAKPQQGEFGRNELGILGTSCKDIKILANQIIESLSPQWKLAYADADHKNADVIETESTLFNGAKLEFTDKTGFTRLEYNADLNRYQKHCLFNDQNLVLVNANHFSAKSQIVVIDTSKPLENKLDKLTDVKLILLKDKQTSVPEYLKHHLPWYESLPIIHITEINFIVQFVDQFLQSTIPPLNGLILSGGKSTRMHVDKGNLKYHGKTQREHLAELISPFCQNSFISCNHQQLEYLDGKFPIIEDKFLGLGPLNGILSALQTDPDKAWLTVACDLPNLTTGTLAYLIKNRNPSKMATAFLGPKGEFPEPLITIWEPSSYSVLLQFLSQGYSCPRKVLINSDIELLNAPDPEEFKNINFPEEYREVLKELSQNKL